MSNRRSSLHWREQMSGHFSLWPLSISKGWQEASFLGVSERPHSSWSSSIRRLRSSNYWQTCSNAAVSFSRRDLWRSTSYVNAGTWNRKASGHHIHRPIIEPQPEKIFRRMNYHTLIDDNLQRFIVKHQGKTHVNGTPSPLPSKITFYSMLLLESIPVGIGNS